VRPPSWVHEVDARAGGGGWGDGRAMWGRRRDAEGGASTTIWGKKNYSLLIE
jgi:hypothetical protein